MLVEVGDWRFTLPDGATPRLDEITLLTATVPAPPPANTTVAPSVPGVLDVMKDVAQDVDQDTASAGRRPQRRGLLDILRRHRTGPQP